MGFRKEIEETAKLHGAEYRGDLSKEVTHLIAKAPTGAKYKHARLWGIKIVTIEWMEQSLERGMVLDEVLYDPEMEESERGKGAWVQRSVSAASLGKREREKELFALPGRKLRRSASSRFDSQSDGFWSDITTAAPQLQPKARSEWDDDSAKKDSVLPNTTEPQGRPHSEPVRQPRPQAPSQSRGIFSGKKFFLHGFDSRQVGFPHGHKECLWLTHTARLSFSRNAFHPTMPKLFPTSLKKHNSQHSVMALSLSYRTPHPHLTSHPLKIRWFRT